MGAFFLLELGSGGGACEAHFAHPRASETSRSQSSGGQDGYPSCQIPRLLTSAHDARKACTCSQRLAMSDCRSRMRSCRDR